MSYSECGVLRAVLQTKLENCDEKDRVGLFIDPTQPAGIALAVAFKSVVGPGRVFVTSPTPDFPEGLPLQQAVYRGIKTVLLDLPNGIAAQKTVDRAIAHGVMPLPLAPRSSWADSRALAKLRDQRRGCVAYIGSGRAPDGADVIMSAWRRPLI